MIVTDKNEIARAVDAILRSPAYLPLPPDVFREYCPGPSAAIHILASDGKDAAGKLAAEWAGAGLPAPGAEVLFVRGRNLLMSDLERIDNALPECPSLRKGLDFTEPIGGGVELWLFVP